MERKQVVVAAAVAVAALTVATGIPNVLASSASSELPKPGVIPITATTVADVLIDYGRRGRSIGDLEVIRQRLFTRHNPPKPIGHSELVCTSTGGNSSNCSGTYFLPRGKIVVSGPRTFREIFEVAVVGGTGIYDNVRGTLTVTSLGGSRPHYLLYFRLII